MDELKSSLEQVLRTIDALGLHGVVILSARCKDCGELHTFRMAATGIHPDDVAGLLTDFVPRAADAPDVVEPQGAN